MGVADIMFAYIRALHLNVARLESRQAIDHTGLIIYQASAKKTKAQVNLTLNASFESAAHSLISLGGNGAKIQIGFVCSMVNELGDASPSDPLTSVASAERVCR